MKREKLIKVLEALLIPTAVIACWLFMGSTGRINQALMPTLPKMLKTAWKLICSGSLWRDICVSLVRVLRGYLVGAILGVVLGTLMGLFAPVRNILNPVVSILRPIPMMALIPLFILWLGIGESCKTALIAVGTFWSVLLNTIQGIQSVDPKLVEVSTILEKDRLTVFNKVYLPSALPSIITGLRLGMGVAWGCVVAAEMLAASKGLGYMLMFSREMARPDKLMVGVFTIGFIGLAIDKGLTFLQNKILWWGPKK